MDEDQLVRRCSGEDRISGLPDELLHVILVGLRSARAAARTSVLSRRWRRVWAYMPELFLDDRCRSSMDAIDAALGASLAPALDRLTIHISSERPAVLARRATPWLLFVSRRAVGALTLVTSTCGEKAALELPACLPAAGCLFPALTSLTIWYGRMDGGALTALVCTQCPRLRNLSILTTLVSKSPDFTIRSDSLISVSLCLSKTRKLEIVAPRLEELCLSNNAREASISAPKLGELVWDCNVYDPRRQQFVDVPRRLRLLEITRREFRVASSLMHMFDEVDVLKLGIGHIPRGRVGYKRFLDGINKLPKCKTLKILLEWSSHALSPTMLHLLRSCISIRTLSLELCDFHYSSGSLCPSSCHHCRFDESRKIDDISLNLLEEVKITSNTSPRGELEFLELLSRCNTPIIKRLVINYNMASSTPPPTKETREKIRKMCPPNIEVKFYVISAKGQVRLD